MFSDGEVGVAEPPAADAGAGWPPRRCRGSRGRADVLRSRDPAVSISCRETPRCSAGAGVAVRCRALRGAGRQSRARKRSSGVRLEVSH